MQIIDTVICDGVIKGLTYGWDDGSGDYVVYAATQKLPRWTYFEGGRRVGVFSRLDDLKQFRDYRVNIEPNLR